MATVGATLSRERGARSEGRVAVIGAGVSGIAAAHYLAQAGHAVEILERNDWLGGRCESRPLGDARSVTLGGKNIGRRYRRFRAFVADLGDHAYEPFGINSSRAREGDVRTVDSGRRYRSMLEVTRGVPLRDLARFAYLAARVRANPENRFLGAPYFARLGRRYDALPISEHFGPELAALAIRPMTVRMNGAEPGEAYLGNLGSNLGMLLDSYDQLEDGLDRVLDEVAAHRHVELRTTVEGLITADGRITGVRLALPDGRVDERAYDGVIVATPAPAAADLLRPLDAELAARLDEVAYYPAAVVIAEYDRAVFPYARRAFVFDDDQPLSNAGAYGISALNVVRYTFSGRAARPHLGPDFDSQSLLELAEDLLSRHTNLAAAQRGPVVSRCWQRAYCAYVPHHAQFRADLESALIRLPGLALAGDYLRGTSIEACFKAAEEAAAVTLPLTSGEHPREEACGRTR